jgi:hypothetical protein
VLPQEVQRRRATIEGQSTDKLRPLGAETTCSFGSNTTPCVGSPHLCRGSRTGQHSLAQQDKPMPCQA